MKRWKLLWQIILCYYCSTVSESICIYGGTDMANNKHLTLDERSLIEVRLKEKTSFSKIAKELGKDPGTISKEIRLHLLVQRIGGININYNACAHRFECTRHHLCSVCHSSRRWKQCRRCSMCNAFCPDFKPVICPKLSKPPYCCNGCSSRCYCSLEKRFYNAQEAHSQYRSLLSQSRTGLSFSEEEIRYLDETISPLIRQKQSPHHICVTNPDTIMVSERTIYRLIDSRIISARNIDLPRKVRFSARKLTVHKKIDKSCRLNRDYKSYLSFLESHPDSPVVQLDTVEGKKGGKVLLTIHFVKAEMMLAFLCDRNDSQSVMDIFNNLSTTLGMNRFKKLFPVCLADNGSEFSNPTALEFDEEQELRTHIFYCDPASPFQKGSAERNHEFIRFS